MTPSIVYRIDSLIQALGDTVLPALGAEQGFAREQAQLVIAHLHLIRQQLPRAAQYDEMELQAARMLGLALLKLVTGHSLLNEAGCALSAALADAVAQEEIQDAIRRADAAVELFVRNIRRHGDQQLINAMTVAVLAHAREKALRSRIWFAGNGFDAERASLPGIESLFPDLPSAVSVPTESREKSSC